MLPRVMPMQVKVGAPVTGGVQVICSLPTVVVSVRTGDTWGLAGCAAPATRR